MWKSVLLLLCLSGYCCAGPLQKRNMPIVPRVEESMAMEEATYEEDQPAAPEMMMSTLTLPSNATSIRADITDSFSCDNKTYGYYADVENDCQIFHVCLPVTYADGKENTFRWSFICPEETIFSQESFTCMRAEDMTISCEESISYYELNRNFGMVSEDKTNENNEVMPIANEDQESEMSMQTEVQQEVVEEPVVVEAAPAPVQTQPIKETKKPFKAPNRRKPGQTKPAKYPLRKLPQATAEIVASEPAEFVVAEEEPKPIMQKVNKRPTTMSTSFKDKIQSQKPEETPVRSQLYNQIRKRPSYFNKKDSTTTTNKPAEEEMAQPELSEPMPTLKLESIFSPVMQAVPEIETEVVAEEEPVAEVEDNASDASENAEVFVKPEEEQQNFVQPEEQHEEETVPEQSQVTVEDVVAPVESEPTAEELEASVENVVAEEQAPEELTSIVAEEQQMPIEEEIVPQIEEDIVQQMPVQEEIVSPVESQQTEEETPEVVKVADAPIVQLTSAVDSEKMFEIAPQVDAENEEAQAVEMDVSHEKINVEESAPEMPIEEESVGAEMSESEITQETESELTNESETHVDEIAVSNESENVEAMESQKEAESAMPIEAIEEIPAVILEVEEHKQETPEQVNEMNSAVEQEEHPNEPSTLEEMEEAKPADAMETMQATPEMEQQDPMVQEMFTNTLKESSGGFKPVDPVMAAEAEALISDFLSKLMKSENTNAQAVYPGENHQESETADETKFETETTVEAEQPVETEQAVEAEQTMEAEQPVEEEKPVEDEQSVETEPIVEAEKAVEQEQAIEAEQSVEAEQVIPEENEVKIETEPVVEDVKTQMLKNGAAMSSMLMPNNLPEDLYHIPVKVVSTSAEEAIVNAENISAVENQETESEGLETTENHVVPMAEEEIQPEVVAMPIEELVGNNDSNQQLRSEMMSVPMKIDLNQNIVEVPEEQSEMVAAPLVDDLKEMSEEIHEQPSEIVAETVNVPELAEQAEEAQDAEIQPAVQEDLAENTEEIQQLRSEMNVAPVHEELVEQQMQTADDMPVYRPLSIDDIVELVKERLDQVPSTEKKIPIEITMPQDAEQELTPVAQSVENSEQVVVAEEKPVETQSEEEIIMPIYNRVNEVLDSNMLKTHTLLVNEPIAIANEPAVNEPAAIETEELKADAAEMLEETEEKKTLEIPQETEKEVPQTETEAQETLVQIAETPKAGRFFRSRSMKNAKMDPRKRRFLFRSDAS